MAIIIISNDLCVAGLVDWQMLKLGRPFDVEMEFFLVVYMLYLVWLAYEDSSAQVSRLTPPCFLFLSILQTLQRGSHTVAAQHSPVCMILAPNGPCSPHLISFCDSWISAEMLLPLGSFPGSCKWAPLHDLTQYSSFCGRTSCLITSVPQALKVPEGSNVCRARRQTEKG